MSNETTSRPTGRPEKPVDWDQVDKLLISQCRMEEIAGFFNLHRNAFSDKCQKHYGITFTEYAAPFYCKGKTLLRNKQYETALKGNIRMMDKLGDVYLEQATKIAIEQKAANQDDIDKDDIIIRLTAENVSLKQKNNNEDQRQTSD